MQKLLLQKWWKCRHCLEAAWYSKLLDFSRTLRIYATRRAGIIQRHLLSLPYDRMALKKKEFKINSNKFGQINKNILLVFLEKKYIINILSSEQNFWSFNKILCYVNLRKYYSGITTKFGNTISFAFREKFFRIDITFILLLKEVLSLIDY